jgi:hypothetical protein
MRSAHLLRRGTADYPAGRKINPEKRNVIIWPVSNCGLSAIEGSIPSSYQLKSGHSPARDESVGRRPVRIFEGPDPRSRETGTAGARQGAVRRSALRTKRAGSPCTHPNNVSNNSFRFRTTITPATIHAIAAT